MSTDIIDFLLDVTIWKMFGVKIILLNNIDLFINFGYFENEEGYKTPLIGKFQKFQMKI